MQELKQLIRCIPDFPKPGILFRDITTLLKEPGAFRDVIERLAEVAGDGPVDVVVGVEARGFLLAGALAYELGAGAVPIRKPGKLPAAVLREEYSLEYGIDALEVHADAITPGQVVLLVDDLLATGGTALAASRLVERLGGEIRKILFLIELVSLRGREKLRGYCVESLIAFEGE